MIEFCTGLLNERELLLLGESFGVTKPISGENQCFCWHPLQGGIGGGFPPPDSEELILSPLKSPLGFGSPPQAIFFSMLFWVIQGGISPDSEEPILSPPEIPPWPRTPMKTLQSGGRVSST